MYNNGKQAKNDTKYEAKWLRATTFAIAKLKERQNKWSNKEKSNIAIKIL